jgi:hypothetical protein
MTHLEVAQVLNCTYRIGEITAGWPQKFCWDYLHLPGNSGYTSPITTVSSYRSGYVSSVIISIIAIKDRTVSIEEVPSI